MKTRIIFLFGLLASLVFCTYFATIYFIWKNPFLPNPKSVDFFIYLLAILGAIAYYRFIINPLKMSFWEGFAIGIGVTGILVVSSVTFIYCFAQYFAPDSLQAHIQYSLSVFEAQKEAIIERFGKKMYDQQILTFKGLTANSMAIYEIYKIFLGGAIALISAILVRK